MNTSEVRYAYGPVPSRRLGRSLGINNIPAKVCTYSCVYCQVGRTTQLEQERRSFYEPEAILQEVQVRLEKAAAASERIDFVTFVPDGEPTLDVNLGREITLLKALGVPDGVITNSSLLGRADVREELCRADWVSLKVDAVQEVIWRRINRPHHALRLSSILDGMLEFSRIFSGRLVTETMLVGGLNDSEGSVGEVAHFLSQLEPNAAYLSIPTRPPAEEWAGVPDEETVNRAYQIFADKLNRVEVLMGYEGDDFAFAGDLEKDLLSITAVHPMRTEAVTAFLSRAGASWEVVDRLVSRGDLTKTEYAGHFFYLRRFTKATPKK